MKSAVDSRPPLNLPKTGLEEYYCEGQTDEKVADAEGKETGLKMLLP